MWQKLVYAKVVQTRVQFGVEGLNAFGWEGKEGERRTQTSMLSE